MTSDTGDKGSGSGPKKPSSSSRRPPTIDLKATELANEPVAGERRPADEPAQPAASESATKPETPQPKSDAKADSVPPHAPESKHPIWDQLPGGLSWPLIGTAVAAGIAFFLLGLALAYLFVGREFAADARLDRLQAIDELSERVTKIETALAAPRTPDAALMNRIAAAEAAAKLAAENAAALQRRAEELSGLVRETRSRADAAAASAEAAQKLSGAASPAGTGIDVDALNQRIAALEQSLKTTEAELARRTASAADDKKSRVAVVASILLTAVERGTPFTAELAAAKALAPDTKALAPLDAFAPNGVPGARAMSRELAAVIPAMLKAADSDTPREGGFLDKLQASAERLVRIRPVGETTGDRPLDVIARLETKANASDLEGALAELSKLPPQVRAPADAWAGKMKARNAALAAARQFSAGALAVIGKPNT
jgi:hypothetical protein